MLTASSGIPYSTVGVVLSAAAGFIIALLGLVKLRGDNNSQAVSQAQGAMETMETLLEAMAQDRDYWKTRCLEETKRRRELEKICRIMSQHLRDAGLDPPAFDQDPF
jgi:hypothetical protein